MNSMKVLLHLCGAHFLKMVVNKVKKIKKNNETFKNSMEVQRNKIKNKNLQKSFIFAFALLQNSAKIGDFIEILTHMNNMFNIKYTSQKVKNSRSVIKKKLIDREYDVLSIKKEPVESEPKFKKKEDRVHHYVKFNSIDECDETNLKQKSPFTIYFNQLLMKMGDLSTTTAATIATDPKCFTISTNKKQSLTTTETILIASTNSALDNDKITALNYSAQTYEALDVSKKIGSDSKTEKKVIIETKNVENEYYCPQMFRIIVEYLHVMPLWTFISIGQWQQLNPKFKKFDRLTNNMVENWFDQLKNGILQSKVTMPSILASKLNNKIEAEYEIHYKNENISLNKSYKSLSFKKEKWKKQKSKQTKGVYYDGIPGDHLFGNLESFYISNDVKGVTVFSDTENELCKYG